VLSSVPAWTSIVTAVSSAVLVLGVFWAARQFFLTQRIARVTETGRLVDDWLNRTPLKHLTDKVDLGPEPRQNALQAFRKWKLRQLDVREDLLNLSRMAERTEIYVRKGAADVGIIAEHLGYDIILVYYCLRPIIRELTSHEDFNFDPFRDLTLRLQDYAKCHPLDVDIRQTLIFATIPPLRYRGGDVSLGYHKSLLYRLCLAVLRKRVMYQTWFAWMKVWDVLNPF
jgi:hypothetical protein